MNTISPDAIRQFILEFFSSLGAWELTSMADVRMKVILVDDVYRPISRVELCALAGRTLLRMQPGAAQTQITDCDDYAMELKNEAHALFRQSWAAGRAAPVPPAVAIVISQNHTVNLFIEQDARGTNSIWLLDASTPELLLTNDPEQAAQMLKKPPVKLIYM